VAPVPEALLAGEARDPTLVHIYDLHMIRELVDVAMVATLAHEGMPADAKTRSGIPKPRQLLAHLV
jgi:hypothetical protein